MRAGLSCCAGSSDSIYRVLYLAIVCKHVFLESPHERSGALAAWVARLDGRIGIWATSDVDCHE